ncbi:MAG: PAS domain-containing protein [Parafilimonas sp.]
MNTSGFFETFFNNAKYNGIVIMDTKGIIININEAFHLRFGYNAKDLIGKNFSVLFTDTDKEIKKPERELHSVLTEGSGSDENYLVRKDGNKVWVTGESVYIENTKEEAYIVKVVHNIHAQKQLERFLLQSHEFIDSVFDSIEESGLLMLDSRLRIIKANKAFIEMFELKHSIETGSRFSDIDNPFWQRPDIKQEVVNFLVINNHGESKNFEIETKTGEIKKIIIQAKVIEGIPDVERKLLVMIKRAS